VPRRMVLVLEPDAIVRSFLLEELREQPDLAAHGVGRSDDALQPLRGARVPIVLFDLPATPGAAASFARALREAVDPWGGTLVAMTSDWGGADAAAVRALGVDVLNKPFADGEPVATIRRLIEDGARRV
jgi:DNA-binding response OmpR family regulator